MTDAEKRINKIKSEIGQHKSRQRELQRMIDDLRAQAVEPGLEAVGLKIGDRVITNGREMEICGADIGSDGAFNYPKVRTIKKDGTPSASARIIYQDWKVKGAK